MTSTIVLISLVLFVSVVQSADPPCDTGASLCDDSTNLCYKPNPTSPCECKEIDCEKVCRGTKVRDCFGLCGGTAVNDKHGNCCVPQLLDVNKTCCNNTRWLDCAGVCNGAATVDCYGVCGGGATLDCEKVCGGDSVKDTKGVCCKPKELDCAGLCNGKSKCYSSSSSVSDAKVPWYAHYGTNVALYAVLPGLLLVATICAVYLRFRAMQTGVGGWFGWLRRGGGRYQTVAHEDVPAADPEWMSDDPQSAPPQPTPSVVVTATSPKKSAHVVVAAAAAPKASGEEKPKKSEPKEVHSPKPLPDSKWDVKWDDEDDDGAWESFSSEAKKPKSLGH